MSATRARDAVADRPIARSTERYRGSTCPSRSASGFHAPLTMISDVGAAARGERDAERDRDVGLPSALSVAQELGAEQVGKPMLVLLGRPAALGDQELVEAWVVECPEDVGCCVD